MSTVGDPPLAETVLPAGWVRRTTPRSRPAQLPALKGPPEGAEVGQVIAKAVTPCERLRSGALDVEVEPASWAWSRALLSPGLLTARMWPKSPNSIEIGASGYCERIRL